MKDPRDYPMFVSPDTYRKFAEALGEQHPYRVAAGVGSLGFIGTVVEVPEWPPRGSAPKAEPLEERRNRDAFETVMGEIPAVSIGYADGYITNVGHDSDFWDRDRFTPDQRRQIADAMCAAWKEWADG